MLSIRLLPAWAGEGGQALATRERDYSGHFRADRNSPVEHEAVMDQLLLNALALSWDEQDNDQALFLV
ncbi:hypothetical protein [Azorhizophilus paspali]